MSSECGLARVRTTGTAASRAQGGNTAPFSGRRHTPFSGRRHGGLLMRALLPALLPFLLGCGSKEPKLLLYCGAGIRPPVAEAAEAFRLMHGISIECDYAGSETLESRIKLSRRGDLYMPGDVFYVDRAQQEGLVASSKTVCYFIPVILVQKDNPQNIQSLTDLTRPGVKVGLGDPEACAIGRKSSEIFQKNNISEEEVNRNVVYRSPTVNLLGDQVKLGHIDAAIVWDAVAAYFAGKTEIVPIPPEQNVISTVAIGVLTSCEHPELAQEFVDFITSDQTVEIFRKHHYATTLPE